MLTPAFTFMTKSWAGAEIFLACTHWKEPSAHAAMLPEHRHSRRGCFWHRNLSYGSASASLERAVGEGCSPLPWATSVAASAVVASMPALSALEGVGLTRCALASSELDCMPSPRQHRLSTAILSKSPGLQLAGFQNQSLLVALRVASLARCLRHLLLRCLHGSTTRRLLDPPWNLRQQPHMQPAEPNSRRANDVLTTHRPFSEFASRLNTRPCAGRRHCASVQNWCY